MGSAHPTNKYLPVPLNISSGSTAIDDIFGRVKAADIAEAIAYGSGQGSLDGIKINHRRGGRGFISAARTDTCWSC